MARWRELARALWEVIEWRKSPDVSEELVRVSRQWEKSAISEMYECVRDRMLVNIKIWKIKPQYSSVSEWVSEWVRERVSERESEWVCESEWMSEWEIVWMFQRVSEWVREWVIVSERERKSACVSDWVWAKTLWVSEWVSEWESE